MSVNGVNDMENMSEDRKSIDYSIIGVDEAGRGPLFGPVVAAAVYLDEGTYMEGIADSKVLSAKKREEAYNRIVVNAKYGIGLATPEEIDLYNIFHATELAMNRALEILAQYVEIRNVQVDGKNLRLSYPSICIVKGDSKVYQISAASILAKVTRDRIMKKFDSQFPQYGLAKHKGYPTSEHIEALKTYGPTYFHRLTFEPIRKMLNIQLLEEWYHDGKISSERYGLLLDLMGVDVFGNIRIKKRKSRKS